MKIERGIFLKIKDSHSSFIRNSRCEKLISCRVIFPLKVFKNSKSFNTFGNAFECA